jgi:hypothetical protein
LGATIKRLKLAKANELAEILSLEAGVPKPAKTSVVAAEIPQKKSAAEPPKPADNPVLTGIFGVNDDLRAEISVNGKSLSLTNAYDPSDLGQWTHGYVLSEGVVLTVAPLSLSLLQSMAVTMNGGLASKQMCKLLTLSDKQCLLLLPTNSVGKDLFAKGGSAAVFQDQVRTLVTQPVPPLNYNVPTGSGNSQAPTSAAPTGLAASASAPARESKPTRPGNFPK